MVGPEVRFSVPPEGVEIRVKVMLAEESVSLPAWGRSQLWIISRLM